MRSVVLVTLLLAGSLQPGPAVATTLVDQFNRLFAPVSQEVANSFARSYPLIAASAGVTYRFDPVTASFEREAGMAGQIFLEQADPIGRGRWNLGVSYQRAVLDTLTFDHLAADAVLPRRPSA